MGIETATSTHVADTLTQLTKWAEEIGRAFLLPKIKTAGEMAARKTTTPIFTDPT